MKKCGYCEYIGYDYLPEHLLEVFPCHKHKNMTHPEEEACWDYIFLTGEDKWTPGKSETIY